MDTSFAVMILSSLRYATYMSHVQEQERAKMARFRDPPPPVDTGSGGGEPKYTTPSRSAGTQTDQTDAMLASMKENGGPSYVALG